jgi:hypothetical protein
LVLVALKKLPNKLFENVCMGGMEAYKASSKRLAGYQVITEEARAGILCCSSTEYEISERTVFNIDDATACLADPASDLNRQLEAVMLYPLAATRIDATQFFAQIAGKLSPEDSIDPLIVLSNFIRANPQSTTTIPEIFGGIFARLIDYSPLLRQVILDILDFAAAVDVTIINAIPYLVDAHLTDLHSSRMDFETRRRDLSFFQNVGIGIGIDAFSALLETPGTEALLEMIIDFDAGSQKELIPLTGMLITIAVQREVDLKDFKEYLSRIVSDAEEIQRRVSGMLQMLGDDREEPQDDHP